MPVYVAQFEDFVVVLVLEVVVVVAPDVIATVEVVVEVTVGRDIVGLGDGRTAGGEDAPQPFATLISTSAQFQN
jgi:hypothetical protein